MDYAFLLSFRIRVPVLLGGRQAAAKASFVEQSNYWSVSLPLSLSRCSMFIMRCLANRFKKSNVTMGQGVLSEAAPLASSSDKARAMEGLFF